MLTRWNSNFSTAIDDFWKPFVQDTFKNALSIKSELVEDTLKIYIALPGVNKEDIGLEYKDELLSLVVAKNSIFIDEFEQSYDLNGYDVKTLKSNLVNGVLTIEIEKKKEKKAIIFKVE